MTGTATHVNGHVDGMVKGGPGVTCMSLKGTSTALAKGGSSLKVMADTSTKCES